MSSFLFISRKRFIIAISGIVFVGLCIFFFARHTTVFENVTMQEKTSDATSSQETSLSSNTDAPLQKQLEHPPHVIKALYLSSWSAGLGSRVAMALSLAREEKINAVVIDIKDSSGYIAYPISDNAVAQYDAFERRIPHINSLIKTFHNANIYIIGRISSFQDPVLAKKHPEFAIHDTRRLNEPNNFNSEQSLWEDNKGLYWLDPSSRPVWDYLAAISNDAIARGFDEVNFDYIRFPSNGELEAMAFPVWNASQTKAGAIRSFFSFIRDTLGNKGVPLSADLFGLVTVSNDDLGIGQKIEDAYEYFDYVCPMVYPSHYANGFIGYQNPANYPYEVVTYSLKGAFQKLIAFAQGVTTSTPIASSSSIVIDKELQEKISRVGKLRPWLQAFDMGARYDNAAIKAQIKASEDVLGDNFVGYLLWDPSNNYRDL